MYVNTFRHFLGKRDGDLICWNSTTKSSNLPSKFEQLLILTQNTVYLESSLEQSFSSAGPAACNFTETEIF